VVSTAEIVIRVSTSINPDNFLGFKSNTKEAIINGLTPDCLLLMSRDVIKIGQVHILGNRLVQEHEVMEVIVMRI